MSGMMAAYKSARQHSVRTADINRVTGQTAVIDTTAENDSHLEIWYTEPPNKVLLSIIASLGPPCDSYDSTMDSTTV